MFIISIVSPKGCNEEQIIQKLKELTGFELVTDDDVFKKVEEKYNINKDKVKSSIFKSSGFVTFDKLKHKKHLCMFKISLAEILIDFSKIYYGVGTYFIPDNLKNNLKVCLGCDRAYRIGNYAKYNLVPLHISEKTIKEFDKLIYQFSKYHLNRQPFSPEYFDVNIDVSKYKPEDIAFKIFELMRCKSTEKIEAEKTKFKDFLIATQIQLHFLQQGEDIDAVFKKGKLTILLRKYKILMENYYKQIKEKIPDRPEIKEVEVIPGKEITISSSMTMKLEKPQKVLLVDDEIEFVDTLSERLQSREFNTAVAYSGEEAIESLNKDLPDVIILDLKMPGIDGLEVLRRVKKEHPETEVIILTGHGSEREKNIAFELGAFAYLEKPVNIELLSETIRKAYEKVYRKKIQ